MSKPITPPVTPPAPEAAASQVVKTHWSVEFKEPGDKVFYGVGSEYKSIDSAQNFINVQLKPRIGKKYGYKRKVVFQICRYETRKFVETYEPKP